MRFFENRIKGIKILGYTEKHIWVARITGPFMRRRKIPSERLVFTFSFSFAENCKQMKRRKERLMLESKFQANLIKTLKSIFPDCVVLKNDAGYCQGIPDLTIFFKDKYALLECKKSSNASVRPNQRYYVDKFDDMSFARFICPENEREVLDELEVFFQ